MPDYSQEIADLEETINAAETSTSVDGTSASVDLDQARKRLRELKRTHKGPDGERKMVRRRFRRINLS